MSEPVKSPTFVVVHHSDGARELWVSHECHAFDPSDPGGRERAQVRLPLNEMDGWQIVNETPLTVRPSILCLECGLHGFVTDGTWVDAQ